MNIPTNGGRSNGLTPAKEKGDQRLWATKVLLVDGDRAERTHTINLLRELGFTSIIEADTGARAWSIVKNQEVGLVLCTWDLPELSGLGLLKVIRSDSHRAAIPFTLIVTDISEEQVVKAGIAGVTDIIIRPISIETFSKKIEEALRIEGDAESADFKEQFDLGEKLMNSGRYEEALVAFQRILRMYESAEVYYNIGYIKSAQGNYQEALHAFRKATEINNTFAKAYEKLAEVYTKLGRREEAQEHLEKAAEIYMERKMDAQAESALMEAIKLNPQTINVYNSLGILYRRRGDHDEAIRQYRKALRVNPQDENILYNLARVFITKKDFKTARQNLGKALEFNPNFIEAQNLLESLEHNGTTRGDNP